MASRLLLLIVLTWGAPAQAGPLQWLRGKVQAHRERRQTIQMLRAIDPLLVPAFKSMKSASAPYSRAHLGSALTLRHGGLLGRLPLLRDKIVKGFNSESEGDLQICAERAAMAGLPRGLARKNPVRKIAVVSDRSVPVPCGRCLQVLSEVGSPETQIVAANLKGQHHSFKLSELLPQKFDVSPAGSLAPYRPLIAKAVRAYRVSRKRGVNQYRPAFGSAVQTDGNRTYMGMVIKDTASTFTPATQTPLDQVVQANVLKGRDERVRTVVLAGEGSEGSRLPVPTADERQHLFDMNPEARVVLYNPVRREGAVITARDLLPHAYQR